LAGWGIGAFTSLQDGIAHLQPPLQHLDPNPGMMNIYEQRLRAYQKISRVLNNA
jgi:hypothetical protein